MLTTLDEFIEEYTELAEQRVFDVAYSREGSGAGEITDER